MTQDAARALTSASIAAIPASLEEVELELAISIEDILAHGFADSVTRAAKAIGGVLLFDMPCSSGDECQRAAAILAGDGEVLLVALSADGQSARVENARNSDAALARFAISHADMLAQLASLEMQ